VAVGIVPGIYTEWTETQNALKGAKGPKYKKFNTRAEAIEFIRTYGDAAAQKTIEDEPIEPPAKKSKKVKEEAGVLHVYTDGSSLSNGKAGAAAGVGVFYGVGDPRFVLLTRHPHGTNY
jgi:ribonuclease HI